MSEVELEGVLSETQLNELAADLGIEADVLRKHPFFRVYRGRILLTYPLKTFGEDWTLDVDNTQADIAASASLTLDKSAWGKALFSQLGGCANSVTVNNNVVISCTALDDNTCTLTNECNSHSAKTGIVALRVT